MLWSDCCITIASASHHGVVPQQAGLQCQRALPPRAVPYNQRLELAAGKRVVCHRIPVWRRVCTMATYSSFPHISLLHHPEKVGLCCCGACSLPPSPSKAADLLEHGRRWVNVAMARVLPESCWSRIGILHTSCRAQPSSSEGRHASNCWARGNARIARQLVRCYVLEFVQLQHDSCRLWGALSDAAPRLSRQQCSLSLSTMQGSRPH